MYFGSFSVKLSDFFKDEPFDSGDGYVRCNCEHICRRRNCPCFTASKFCTESCTCQGCLNVPPAKNRGKMEDSCSRFEDEGEDTYWTDWCRETEKSSPWKSIGNKEDVHRRKPKPESESFSLEDAVRNLEANKPKRKRSTSIIKKEKEE